MTLSTHTSDKTVQEGSYLTLHYRISLASGPAQGQIFTDTYTGKPATLLLQSGQWAPGIEAPLIGLHEGSEHSYVVPAAEAYGERNPELLQHVTLALLKEHAEEQEFSPGDLMEFAGPNGMRYSGVIKEVHTDTALIDFNHPLAGTDIKVDVSILGVM